MEDKKKLKSLSGKLMRVTLPVTAAGLLITLAVVAATAQGLIKNLLYTSLEQQVTSDAGEINKQLNSTFYYLNGVGDAVETIHFQNDDEINEYLATSLNRYDMIPTGAYLALSDASYIDPSGWTYETDVRELDWYKQGASYDNKYYYYYDEPYFDNDTGNLCATVIRHVHLQDGREGVLACDLMMGAAGEYLNAVSIYGSGRAIMVTSSGMILSDPNSDVVGMMIADQTDDQLLTSIGGILGTPDGEVQRVTGNDGTYFAVPHSVGGTDWYVVDYAKSGDVLTSVYRMIIILAIVVIGTLVLSAIVLTSVIGRLIKRPVEELTGNIESISKGDFTVSIAEGGNDEIAYMNGKMGEFIQTMKSTMSDIQVVAGQLEDDSRRSKETAEALSGEATEQSAAMEQMMDSMEGMSESVTEVAENATQLAETIAILSDSEEKVQGSMTELVKKADAGQKDMSTVSRSMDNIVGSMNEMNTAVEGVDKAAEEITHIVDMISDIAGQTNLLSLNASIEAARAGEAGRGFAVVATEIAQLSNNSASATKQIADIIQEMTAKVRDLAEKSSANTSLIHESADSVNKAAETFSLITAELNDANRTMTEMARQMGTVNDVATNMAAVSQEQSASAQEITSTITKLTASARNVAESSGTVSTAAASVSEAADQINDNVKYFKIE